MQPLQKQRPVFLNLFLIRFPAPAVLSILHRISGAILVLAFPVLLYLFSLSLNSAGDFAKVHHFLTHGIGRLGVLLVLWSISHHFFAGIRYFLIDLEWIISRQAAIQSAWITIVIALISTAVLFLGLIA